MEGKSGGHSAPILLTPEIVRQFERIVMLASRCTYCYDGQVPARQPGSGKAKVLTRYANPEQSCQRETFGIACVEHGKVSANTRS